MDLDLCDLDTGARVSFGRALSTYATLVEQAFSGDNSDPKNIHAHLVELGINISLRRVYELNQLQPCVSEAWFSEDLRREEIRALRSNPKNTDPDQVNDLNSSIKFSEVSSTERSTAFEVAKKMAISAHFKIYVGDYLPYVVNSSSIKRDGGEKMATIAFALILASPIFSNDRSKHSPALEHAKTWPEPIIADSLEHLVVEMAKKLGFTPAWALTSGSRILHESYIEPWIKRDYLLLVGLETEKF